MPICGAVITRAGAPIQGRTIQAMLSALAVGLGGASIPHTERDAGLGVVSSCGTGSLWDDGKLLVVADAELQNLEELRGQVGPPADRESVSCLLAQLYRERGSTFVTRLRGTFSFAIWDRSARTLLLGIDRFGVQPLCYHAGGEQFVFASAPRGILASARVEKRIDRLGLVNYLNFTVVPAPLCAFEGITKLAPATLLKWREGNTTNERYWNMTYPEDAGLSTQGLAQELLGRMEEAVQTASAGVPTQELGCFLSGGTDSSSILGLVTQVRQEPVTSISIDFAEERYSELSYAELAARHFRSRHLTARLGPEQAYGLIPKIVEAYDEPYANASAIPTYHCERLACEHGIKVMLAGDGGDELFGGNERYRTHKLYEIYQRIPGLLRRRLIEPVLFRLPSAAGPVEKFRRYIEISNSPNPDRYFRWNLLQRYPMDEVLGPETALRNGQRDPLAVARGHYESASTRSELNRLLYVDVQMTLGDNDLPKVVRTAELAGMRVRFPYLDHPLAEFSGRIPAPLKVKGLEKRYLFKQATRELLPGAILRKKKHGFGLPVGLWMKTDPLFRGMAEEVLLDPRTYQRGYFRRPFVERLFAEMGRDNTAFFGDLLWEFVMLELWHRRHVEGSAL
jgi:asparagine synthase (glutamine-hydrolysing)